MIDFFASRCCTSVAVGDLTARWMANPPSTGFTPLAPIEGVPLVADERLLDLLASAGPTIRLGGPPFARHLAIDLDDPAAWIDFLGTPAALRRR